LVCGKAFHLKKWNAFSLCPFSEKEVISMAQPPLPYDYYYGSEADQYTFYRLPKALFTDSRYKNLSDGAKILYGLMLDRMGLSMKNGWLDERNRVYIFFTLEDLQEYMNCGHNKGVKLMAELDTIGLIERVKQGQGKPARVFVRKFFATGRSPCHKEKADSYPQDYPQGNQDFREAEVQTSDNGKSRLPRNGSADFPFSDTNKNKSNNTDFNDTEYQSVCQENRQRQIYRDMTDKTEKMKAYRDLIMENIEYGCLIQRYGREWLDGIVDLMVETVCTSRPSVHINSEEYPAEVVKSRLLKLDSSDIEFAYDRLDEKTTKVYNIRAYTLTTLYNAPTDKEEYYRSAVKHDMYGSD